MIARFKLGSRHGVIYTLVVLAIVGAIFILPFQMRSKAAKGLFQRTESHENGLPNYDIRTDKTAGGKLAGFRLIANKNVADVADARDSFVKGETALYKNVPTLKIEYNNDIRIPEVIATDVKRGKAFLTPRSAMKRVDILFNFLNENSQLIGARGEQVRDLKVTADYTNPDGNLSFVELDQEVGGIPVFRGEVKAGFTKNGELIRVINNFAPGLDYASLPTDFGDASAAVRSAAGYINLDNSKLDLNQNKTATTDLKTVFGTGDSATTAEKMYFPTEPGVAVPAWRVLIWQPVNAYYVIVDARDGTMLWRKNITEDQTQPATYSIYANPNAMINVGHSPFPFSPGPISPNGMQGAAIPRTSASLVGNEAPYTFNNLGWIADGVTITDGNAVQAGLDRDGVDGVDANSEAFSPTRNFAFAYNPFDPNTNTGDAPVTVPQTYPGSAFQQGAVTQLFYICNWYHDETYRLGFNEAARNFQNTNFTGQGVGVDRVRGEAQDSSGTNNANFSTPADGGRGRMQMYIFTGPNPDIDGSLDADVVVHEHTHGLSNRLHGNSSGLFNDMSRGMGEGWSDFYGISMLSGPGDDVNGNYTTGAYVSYLISNSFVNNEYYGIRRFPYAVMSSVGGPNNRPHNPLTFADLDTTQINLDNGAFAPRTNGTSDEVHNAGEIWCSALWEIRARMVTRLGWSVGNRKALQLVTDGMKLAPFNPTFLSERDAIIAAGLASDPAADVADIWAGFATRGLGASASIQNVGGNSIGGTGTARVTEAFDLPNLSQTPNLTILDHLGNATLPQPGMQLTLRIPLANLTGNMATGVAMQVVCGGSANYGNLAGGVTASRDITYTVPGDAVCGSVITLTLNVTNSLGPVSFTRDFAVGQPETTFTENFDAVTPPAIPAGWSVTSAYAPMTFVSTAASSDSGANSMFAADLPNCTTGCPPTDGGSTELTSPVIHISVAAGTVTFRHRYNSENGFDGGVLEYRNIAGGEFQDIVAAGGTFLQNGYNGQLGVSTPNPLGGRAGWTGDSGGYITTIARLPVTANGQNVQLRWRFGADNNGAPAGGGWNVDTIQVVGSYLCFTMSPVEVSGRVMTADGRGLRNATVRISDQNGFVRVATTSSFGFYQFTDILPGATYTVGVSSRFFRFAPRVMQINGSVFNLDFTGQE